MKGAMTDITTSTSISDEALQRRLKRLGLAGEDDGWADRYLLCEHIVEPTTARARQRFEAVARFSRDLIAHRWVKTRETRERVKPKRVYYLSLEFLIGRVLHNNMVNMNAEPLIARALEREGWSLSEILERPNRGRVRGCNLECRALSRAMTPSH